MATDKPSLRNGGMKVCYHGLMKKVMLVLGLVLILILIRSINLLKLPLYLDEGLYISWAHLFSSDLSFAYVSLQDGKTPLFIWLTAALNPLVDNYLLAGRLISVIAGAITALCWMIILKKYTDDKTVFFFWLLFLLAPFGFLIERMAFVDSLLVAFGSLSLMCWITAFHFFKEKKSILPGILLALISGIILGIAYMTKTSARLYLIAEMVLGIIWIFPFIKQFKVRAILLASGGLLVLWLSYQELIGYMRVGAHRFWSAIALKEHELTFSLPDIINIFFKTHDFSAYLRNLPFIGQYFLVYFGVILILAFLGLAVILKNKLKVYWLVIYIAILFFGIFLSGKMTASRYFYMLVPATLALAAFGAVKIWQLKSRLGRLFLLFCLVVLMGQDLLMLINPLQAFYSTDDQGYLLGSELSAFGLDQTITELKPLKTQVIVAVSGTWGVQDGIITLLKQQGIDAMPLNSWLQESNKDQFGNCQRDQRLIENHCYKLNIQPVLDSQKAFKFLYLTRAADNIAVLDNFGVIKDKQVFKRPLGDSSTYLIKL